MNGYEFPVWMQNVAFAIADRWCRTFYRKGWVEMPCRRCGEARYNHVFGRFRGTTIYTTGTCPPSDQKDVTE